LVWISKQVTITAVLLLSLYGIAFAGSETITEIVIKGNRKVESSVIRNTLKLRTGDLLAIESVDEDIRAIYKLGYFQDVKAESVKGDAGVILMYAVTEKPVVREIKIDGNKEIAADKIREAFTLKPNAIMSATDLNSGVKKVKKLYTDQGYYLAEVNASSVKRPDGDITLTLKISEEKKVLIKTIRFEGNKTFSARKLKKVMETGEKWILSWITDAGTYKEEVLKNDVALIADLYYNNGYVNVKVGEPKVEILPDKSGLVVTIGITEGDQFRTGSISFKGDLLESKEILAGKLKLKTGEVFSRTVLRGDISVLTDIYADKGYAFTNVNPLSAIDFQKKTISFTFEFEKGEKIYFDRINISGNTKTRDKVIRREMRFAEGELFSATGLKKSKQSLMNLGYFEQANVAIAKGSAANRQHVNVEVKEKATGTFSIGAGYSSLDGIVGQGSVQQTNFLGLGLKANLSASLGGKTQTYNVGITDPHFLDSKWTLGTDIYRTQRDFTDFTRRVTGGDIKAGYPLSDTLNTLWVYKYEDKVISKESQALLNQIANGLVTAPEATSTTSSITASLTRNTTDYRPDPTRGMINSVSTEFAGLGGTSRFVRSIANTTVFFPVKWGTFSLRGEIGYIGGYGGKDVPIDEKFYLGGINTVRGYASRTVSPYRDTEIDKIYPGGFFAFEQKHPIGKDLVHPIFGRAFTGGNAEAFMNAEYVFPIIKEAGLKGVLFFDAGNSSENIGDIFSSVRSVTDGIVGTRPVQLIHSFASVQASYGFGFRWFSPMGPLRIEYGIPLNPRTGVDKASGKLEFAIGGFF
jgi:outer membrane protein insertion porin family